MNEMSIGVGPYLLFSVGILPFNVHIFILHSISLSIDELLGNAYYHHCCIYIAAWVSSEGDTESRCSVVSWRS